MAVLRTVARPMLASTFILQGYQTLRHPELVAPAADPVVQPIAERLSFLTDDPEQAVRINGAVHLVAGSLLAIGRLPRLSALALAVTMVPTTWAGHRFWEAEDEQERMQQKIHFLKNLTMMGGLLIAAVDTGAQPSLVWRGRHALHEARHDVSLAARTARTTARATRGPAAMAVRTANTTSKARKMPAELSARATKTAGKVSKVRRARPGMAGKAAKTLGKAQAEVAARTAKTAGRATKTAGKISKAPMGIVARTGKKAGKAKGAQAAFLARFNGGGKAYGPVGKASAEMAARSAQTVGRAREASAVAAARAAKAAETAAKRSAAAAEDMRSRLPVG